MTRIGLFLALAILLPAPLAAQDAQVDAGAVAACFAGTDPGDVDPGCIGAAAEACQQTHPQGQTTLGISGCLMAEAGAWDNLLNREYRLTRDGFTDQPGLPDTLLAAQRAWIALRDADCALAYDRYGGGSMRVIAAAHCRLRHTARRALELRDMRGM